MPASTRREFLITGASLVAGPVAAMAGDRASGLGPRRKKRVVVWSEGTAPRQIYPHDINTAIAEGLTDLRGWQVETASINQPDQGLPAALLNETDALVWWGHERHGEVRDELVGRIAARTRAGAMGFIATHSAHWSKPFKALMGTSCSWGGGYTDDGSKLDVVVMAARHPIARDIRDFVVPHTERYGEPFDVPAPQTVIFDGIYSRPDGTAEHSRQGMTWTVERGRVFYFQPGHEAYPIYFQPEIRHVFRNAVAWVAAPQQRA